jgi:hypothetical protein
MATRLNIGNITSAIQRGQAAYDNIGYGPVIPATMHDGEHPQGDWGAETIDNTIFIAGVHKWGDTTLRVTK